MTEEISNSPNLSVGRASAESLKVALSAVEKTFGRTPSQISSAVRSLLADHVKGAKARRPSIEFHVTRLFRVPTIKAAFYYVCLGFKTDEFDKFQAFDVDSVLEMLPPDDIASLVSMIYLYRRAKAICSAEEWGTISSMVQTQANISIYYGQSVPRIGIAASLIVGVLPVLSMAVFHKLDEKGFKEYRRHLKASSLVVDHDFERNKWGCDSVQIAAKLAQSVGLGIATAEALTHMMSTLHGENEETVVDNLRLPVAYCWINSLGATGKPPTDLDEERLTEIWPTAPKLAALLDQVQQAGSKSSRFLWLDKGKADLSPESTPKIFSKGSEAAKNDGDTSADQGQSSGANITDEFPYSKLSPELREMISEEDFNSMSYDERKQLVGDGANSNV